jgi:hypothetical protein
MSQWKGVPPHARKTWDEIFAISQDGIDVPALCPVCRAEALHRYFAVGTQIFGSKGFFARGAAWEWCSKCFSYEHSAVLVPTWWRSSLDIDEKNLTATPDMLNSVVEARMTQARRVRVVELRSNDASDSLVARFVLRANGKIYTVAPSEQLANVGRKIVSGIQEAGKLQDEGQALLELLCATIRQQHAYAASIIDMDEGLALNLNIGKDISTQIDQRYVSEPI